VVAPCESLGWFYTIVLVRGLGGKVTRWQCNKVARWQGDGGGGDGCFGVFCEENGM
jgi:hypothetical protein